MLIRPTETIAREVINGLAVEVDDLIREGNDGNALAWQNAILKSREITRTLEAVVQAIQARELRPAEKGA